MIETRKLYFEATIFSEPAGEEKISGTLTAEEHQAVLDFMQYADELAKTPFLRSSNRGSAKISHARDEPVKFDVTLPDWTEVVAFIHLLRPFILQKESTNFYKVANIVGKHTKNSQVIRSMLAASRDIFSTRRDQDTIQIRSNESLLNSEETLQAYLNGFEYHRDKDKQAFIEGLHQMLPLDFSKVIFVGLLLEKARAIFDLADLIAVITGKQKEIEFQFNLPNTGQRAD
jgi:hypothetical protein